MRPSSFESALVALVTILLLCACSPQARRPTTSTVAQTSPLPPSAAPLEMKPTVPTIASPVAPTTTIQAPSQAGQKRVPEQVLAPGPSLPSTPRYFNVGVAPITHIPSDFALGPLEDVRAPDARVEQIVAACTSFLDGLVAGTLIDSVILKGRKLQLAALVSDIALDKASSQKPRVLSWRLGRIAMEADEALASLALYAAIGDPSGNLKLPPRALGEIRARYVDKTWYIEDISFSAADLERDRPLAERAFEPPVGSDTSTRGN